ncbi:MAG: nucleoid-associated protein [Provencibacterium sp.]|jgi:nucleoid-associated protein YejK|nr:nucleoid-associated protein [Provencibacterium sp.]
MPLLINHAILHTISNDGSASVFSETELDVDSETCSDFVGRHVRRLLHNPGAKEATFKAESQVYGLIRSFQKSEIRFGQMSRLLCERLAEIMQGNEDIPPAAILIAAFDNAGQSYIAILKLNFIECYTHRVLQTENGLGTQLIKNPMVLPLSAGKVEEACLIPYEPMLLRVFEKPHRIGGEEICYFSERFLECETEISKKDAAEILLQITGELNDQHFGGDAALEARVKCAVIEEAEENETAQQQEVLQIDRVARRVFSEPEEEGLREEFIAMAEEQGLPRELPIDRSFARRAFKMQRLKTENGIEISCPAELFQDPDTVVLENHSDGSFTITFKNLRRYCPREE